VEDAVLVPLLGRFALKIGCRYGLMIAGLREQ
jgi:hypothetical protein